MSSVKLHSIILNNNNELFEMHLSGLTQYECYMLFQLIENFDISEDYDNPLMSEKDE